MKFKPTNKPGGVVVELGPKEAQLPGTSSGPAPAVLTEFKLKKILVPVDFSDCSNKALQYAIPFAKQFNAKLILLYVVQPYLPVPEFPMVDVEPVLRQIRETGKKELEKLQRTVGNKIPLEIALREGTPYLEIINAVKELGIDLIILSTHGRTGLAHIFIGSTAERVVRHAGCPVLVVREREREFVAGKSADTRG